MLRYLARRTYTICIYIYIYMFMRGYMWGPSVHMANRVYLELHFEIAVYILISNTLYSTGKKIFTNLGFLCERVITSTTYIYLLVNISAEIRIRIMRISGYPDNTDLKFWVRVSGSSVKVLSLPLTCTYIYRGSGKTTPRKNVNNPLSQTFLSTYDLP